jgi:hypothetical protein
MNRKMLSELAITDPAAFDAIVAIVTPHITGRRRRSDRGRNAGPKPT